MIQQVTSQAQTLHRCHIAGNFRGRKLLWSLLFCRYSRKFSPQKLGALCPLVRQKWVIHKSFLWKNCIFHQFTKVSPSQVSRNTFSLCLTLQWSFSVINTQGTLSWLVRCLYSGYIYMKLVFDLGVSSKRGFYCTITCVCYSPGCASEGEEWASLRWPAAGLPVRLAGLETASSSNYSRETHLHHLTHFQKCLKKKFLPCFPKQLTWFIIVIPKSPPLAFCTASNGS